MKTHSSYPFTLNFQSHLSLAPIMWESPAGYPGSQVEHRLLMINISWGCSQKARCSLQDLFHHFFFSPLYLVPPRIQRHLTQQEFSLFWRARYPTLPSFGVSPSKVRFLTQCFSSHANNTKLQFVGRARDWKFLFLKSHPMMMNTLICMGNKGRNNSKEKILPIILYSSQLYFNSLCFTFSLIKRE